MIRFVILLVALLVAAPGCNSRSGYGAPAPPRTTSVTEQQAIDAAKAAVKEHDNFADKATYQARPSGNGWTIMAEYGKQGRFIALDAEGKVISYESR